MPILADGTDIAVNDGASSAYVDITGVISFTPPNPEVGEYDSTHLNSTAGTMTKKPKSRAEPDRMSITMWYDESEYERLIGLRGTEKNFKITYPDSSIDTFAGFIRSVVRQESQNQEPMKMVVNIQNQGAITRS